MYGRSDTVRILILCAALAVGLTACSSDGSAGDTIPSSDDVVAPPTVATTTPDERVTDPEEVSRLFSSCMRDEGIDFPDVRIDDQNRPIIGDALEGLDTADPTFQSALTSCSSILASSGALDVSSDPELQAAIIDQLASFSECMRSEDVDEFPDPNPGFTGAGSPYPLDQIPLGDPAFRDAIAVCGSDLGSFGFEG